MTRRILVAIPHFYRQGADQRYGSGSDQPQQRLNALVRCLAGLHQSLGSRHGVLEVANRRALPANDAIKTELDVVVCTTGAHHLMDRFKPVPGLYRHEVTEAEPMRLVYECHRVLREARGRYDYYAYMEDDLVIHDALFLEKLTAFNNEAGPRALLQPNRYEVALGRPFDKFYVDGDLSRDVVTRFVDFGDGEPIQRTTAAFGRTILFERTLNPHSGCFFLNAAQLETWLACSAVVEGRADFIGPLESAATLGLMQSFAVYKAASECAGYLEIEHGGTRFLSLVGRTISVDPGLGKGHEHTH